MIFIKSFDNILLGLTKFLVSPEINPIKIGISSFFFFPFFLVANIK